jgi:hypothetical protein
MDVPARVLLLHHGSKLFILVRPRFTPSVTPPVRRTPPTILAAMLATAILATSPTAADGGADESPSGRSVHLYFDVKDGALVLSPEPPLIQDPGTWTVSGFFDSRRGLRIEVPVENPNPDVVVFEDQGVSGWIAQSFVKKQQGSIPSVFGPAAGSFSWTLVEGSQQSKLVLDCRYNDPYYCGRDKVDPRYVGEFPGHGEAARPHRHGNQSAPSPSLRAGEFSWMLAYTIPPCTSLTCPPLSSTYQYTWTLQVDGTTFVEYYVEDAATPPPVTDLPPSEEATNETGNESPPAEPEDPSAGNSTGNTTSSQGSSTAAGPAVRVEGYRVEPRGSAPTMQILGVLGALGAAVALRRR